MSTRTITQLPRGPKGYRSLGDLFETKAKAIGEDDTRIRLITKVMQAPAGTNYGHKALKQLRKRISDAATPASSVYMRRFRKRLIPQLWRLVDTNRSPVRAFTIVPERWRFTPEELALQEGEKLMEQFRSWVMRCREGDSSGWLFAGIHGEFDAEDQVFQLHVHGIATEGMIEAVSALRKKGHLKSYRSGPKRGRVTQQVQVEGSALTNLPHPLGYLVQSFWPQKQRYIDDQGVSRKSGRRRIDEPFHTDMLMWLDEHSPEELTRLMGLRPGKKGLVRIQKRTRVPLSMMGMDVIVNADE